MTAALKDLCLVTCASDAVTALMAIHKELGDIAVRTLWELKAPSSFGLSTSGRWRCPPIAFVFPLLDRWPFLPEHVHGQEDWRACAAQRVAAPGLAVWFGEQPLCFFHLRRPASIDMHSQ